MHMRRVVEMNELILMPTDTSGVRCKGIKFGGHSGGKRARSHEAKICHKNHFQQDISRIDAF